MAVTLNGKISLIMSLAYADQSGVQPKQANVGLSPSFTITSGTGANQADKIYAETITIAASGSATRDLAGSLTDVFGVALTFVKVKGIFVSAASANTNNVLIGNAGATQFLGPFGAAAHTVAVLPGGLAAFVAPNAAAWAVAAGSADVLGFANSSSGTSVTFDLVIIGTSA